MARKTQQPIDISTLFGQQHSGLAKIAEKQQALLQLQHIVSEICPDLPVNGWKIANIQQKTLIIEVNNAVWAHRFQFEKNTILRALAENNGIAITQLKVNVAPQVSTQYPTTDSPDEKTEKLPPSQHNMPAQVSEQLTDLASHAPKGLQQALLRLAQYKKS